MLFRTFTMQPNDTMPPDDDLPTAERVADEALDAFWEVVVDHFPWATTGDLSVERSIRLDVAAEDAVREWIDNNAIPRDTNEQAA